MEFERIISKTLAEVYDEFGDDARLQFQSESSQSECLKPHILLRTYSEKLIENYHNELKELLHKQGIEI